MKGIIVTTANAKVGKRVILLTGLGTEKFRGVIHNIGHDRDGDQEGMTVKREDKLTGSGIDRHWFCPIRFDTNIYFSGGDSQETHFIFERISWKDIIN